MSSRAARYRSFLHFIVAAGTHRQRRAVLTTANRGQILALAEVTLNLLKGNHSLSEEDQTNLSCYKNSLRILGAKSRTSWEKRKSAALKCVRVLKTVITHVLDNNIDD